MPQNRNSSGPLYVALTATIAISAVPQIFNPSPASQSPLDRIERIRSAITGGGHEVLVRRADDRKFVPTQFAQNFSNSR